MPRRSVRVALVGVLVASAGCSAGSNPPDAGATDTPVVDTFVATDTTDMNAFDVATDTIDVAMDASTDVAPIVDASADVPVDAPSNDATSTGRDWTAHPAIVQLPPASVLYAVSDVHGGYDRLITLLVANGILAGPPATPSAAQWTAGAATLVVTGDLFDKGPKGLEDIDVFRALEVQAATAGGTVIVALGNHEAEFLVDPLNSKATATDGVDVEIDAMGLTPAMVADPSDPRGRWLRDRPFGVKVGNWFFAHAGNTAGRTIAQLEAALEPAVDVNDFNDPEVIGTNSILEARGWYSVDPSIPSTYAAALGVGHIVFGHQPSALGPTGAIAMTTDGILMRIDCGMSPDVNDSSGCLLRITSASGTDSADSLAPDGSVQHLWSGPSM